MIRFFPCFLGLAATLQAAPIDLRLPTENRHIFSGELDRFYMYVDRTFEGEISRPWEGGSYGFVRTPLRVGPEVVLTKVHDGIDIAPVKRDKAGNPLDLVSSIADGTVVHTSPLAGRSNYGKYLVVEHPWEGSSIYSLYAHLADITVQPGDVVKAGSVLGRMGFTGVGINRTRAHVHLELTLLRSTRYEDWHKARGGGVNYHGIFNGLNLTGTDVARFFLEQRKNPELRFSEFIAATPVYFRVTVPSTGVPDFLQRHPWMGRGSPSGANSWEISFSATGQPIDFTASERRVTAPIITHVRPSEVPHRHLTRGLVIGEGNQASLSTSGKQLVSLLMDDFPAAQP